MNNAIDAFCRFLSALMALALLIMVVLVFGNVILRYGLNTGITISEELSRWLFVWLTFIGAVVALKRTATWAPTAIRRRRPSPKVYTVFSQAELGKLR